MKWGGFRAFLRQPVVYFVLLGAAVFAIDARLRRTGEPILASDALRAEVAVQTQGNLGRPPTAEELDQAVQDWTDTEVLFREAESLGLEQNDAVIRTHLANKLRYIVRQRTLPEAAKPEELAAQLNAHPERYTKLDTYDVSHVFFNAALARSVPDPRLKESLSKLEAGAGLEGLGDHFPRGPRFSQLTRNQLEQILNTQLAEPLQARQQGKWQTLTSQRGTHLVRLDAVHSGKPDLAALQPVLAADVEELKKDAALRTFTADLRKKYGVEPAPAR